MKREELKLGMQVRFKATSVNQLNKLEVGKVYKVVGLYLENSGILSVGKLKALDENRPSKGLYLSKTDLVNLEEYKPLKLYAFQKMANPELGAIVFSAYEDVNTFINAPELRRTPEFDIEY